MVADSFIPCYVVNITYLFEINWSCAKCPISRWGLRHQHKNNDFLYLQQMVNFLKKKRCIYWFNSFCRKTHRSVEGVILCSPLWESLSLFNLSCLSFISDTCNCSNISHLFGFRLGSTESQRIALCVEKPGSALCAFCLIASAFVSVSGLDSKVNLLSLHAR